MNANRLRIAANGTLNLSILDGWWAEAYDGINGFAIGSGKQHADEGEQDRRDADERYSVLTQKVIPLFYDRDERGVPTGWVARIKHAIQSLAWRFNAGRMVKQYALGYSLPSVGTGQPTSISSV